MDLDLDYGQFQEEPIQNLMEVSGKPLLEHAINRAKLISDHMIIVTNQDHYFLTKDLVESMNIDVSPIYILGLHWKKYCSCDKHRLDDCKRTIW